MAHTGQRIIGLVAALLIAGASQAVAADENAAPAGSSAESSQQPPHPPVSAPEKDSASASKPSDHEQQTTTPVNTAPAETAKVLAKPVVKKPTGYDEAAKLYGSGKYAAAVQKLEASVKDGTADDNCHLYLAASYRGLKQWDKAIAEYNWLAKHSKSLTQQRTAEGEAYTLTCYRKGICPGHCLKATDPGWHHMTVAGHGPEELWMTFPYNGGSHSWSQHHLGEVIEYVNGMPVNKGQCPICHGTGHVTPLK